MKSLITLFVLSFVLSFVVFWTAKPSSAQQIDQCAQDDSEKNECGIQVPINIAILHNFMTDDNAENSYGVTEEECNDKGCCFEKTYIVSYT